MAEQVRKWQQEFGTCFAVPAEIDALVDAGVLKDISWHNDACPRFETPLGGFLWVDHPEQAEREMQDEYRYVITDSDQAIYLETNDLPAVLAYIDEAKGDR